MNPRFTKEAEHYGVILHNFWDDSKRLIASIEVQVLEDNKFDEMEKFLNDHEEELLDILDPDRYA